MARLRRKQIESSARFLWRAAEDILIPRGRLFTVTPLNSGLDARTEEIADEDAIRATYDLLPDDCKNTGNREGRERGAQAGRRRFRRPHRGARAAFAYHLDRKVSAKTVRVLIALQAAGADVTTAQVQAHSSDGDPSSSVVSAQLYYAYRAGLCSRQPRINGRGFLWTINSNGCQFVKDHGARAVL